MMTRTCPRSLFARISAVAAFVAFGLMSQLSCASSPRSGVSPELVVLRPGSRELSTGWLAESSEEQRYVGASPTDTAEWQRYDEHVALTTVGVDGSQMLLAKAVDTHGHAFRDTLVFRRRGLVPVWEHMRYDSRLLAVNYSGARVHVSKQSGDSIPRSYDTTFAEPVFGFNQLDLVVRSLPLRDGFEAVLPLYSEGSDALEMDTVTVVGRAVALGGTPVWTVRFADPVIISTYGIDESTRQIKSYEVGGRRGSGRSRRAS